MKWEEATFGNFFKIKHGYAFKSKFFSDAGEYILLTPGNFRDEGGFKFKEGKEKYYVGDIPDGYVLKHDDLIVAMTEQMDGLLGSSALIPNDNRFLHNQRLGLVVDLKEESLDKKFLYYLFNTYPVRSQIRASATGTKVKHTAPERIGRVGFFRPATDVQRRIASILCSYDDLIENNLRRIKLLEESARLLYKEWFVRLRFPGYEHTRIVNGVPEGWQKKDLREVIGAIESGGRPKGGSQEEGIPSVGAENITGIGQYDYTKEKFIPEDYFAKMNQGIVKEPRRACL